MTTSLYHNLRKVLSGTTTAKCFPHLNKIVVRSSSTMATDQKFQTSIIPVDVRKIGKVTAIPKQDDILDDINIDLDPNSPDASHIRLAAEQLRTSDIPVAFPTETVYGLGADATRSAAVNGIYKAKQRPADNPLIVHFASLEQLRHLLRPSNQHLNGEISGHMTNGFREDPIPGIYKPLISRFWPGPLTIILRNPLTSPLAPEVTAGLNTFGARIPGHVLALALIKLSNKPIAAPSANASTKPSPTAAEHVAYDLDGRIETIIDGGPCDVGVESTVVDGLSDPPLILRPGGVSIEQLQSCPGWENVRIGYKNASEADDKPKAPGMKYRHYSPRATVVLYEPGKPPPRLSDRCDMFGSNAKLGIITTKRWMIENPSLKAIIQIRSKSSTESTLSRGNWHEPGFAGMLESAYTTLDPASVLVHHNVQCERSDVSILHIPLGGDTAYIARGIFSALRQLDKEGVNAIYVEGIDESEGDTAAAVMNRLRKAAEIEVAG